MPQVQPLPADQNFLNFIQFFGKFGKIVCCRPPLEGWRLLLWKSWIKSWIGYSGGGIEGLWYTTPHTTPPSITPPPLYHTPSIPPPPLYHTPSTPHHPLYHTPQYHIPFYTTPLNTTYPSIPSPLYHNPPVNR